MIVADFRINNIFTLQTFFVPLCFTLLIKGRNERYITNNQIVNRTKKWLSHFVSLLLIQQKNSDGHLFLVYFV